MICSLMVWSRLEGNNGSVSLRLGRWGPLSLAIRCRSAVCLRTARSSEDNGSKVTSPGGKSQAITRFVQTRSNPITWRSVTVKYQFTRNIILYSKPCSPLLRNH